MKAQLATKSLKPLPTTTLAGLTRERIETTTSTGSSAKMEVTEAMVMTEEESSTEDSLQWEEEHHQRVGLMRMPRILKDQEAGEV